MLEDPVGRSKGLGLLFLGLKLISVLVWFMSLSRSSWSSWSWWSSRRRLLGFKGVQGPGLGVKCTILWRLDGLHYAWHRASHHTGDETRRRRTMMPMMMTMAMMNYHRHSCLSCSLFLSEDKSESMGKGLQNNGHPFIPTSSAFARLFVCSPRHDSPLDTSLSLTSSICRQAGFKVRSFRVKGDLVVSQNRGTPK